MGDVKARKRESGRDCALHIYRFGKNPARKGLGGDPDFFTSKIDP